MDSQTLLADPVAIRLVKIVSATDSLTFLVKTIQKQCACPSCGEDSSRIHSHYTRTVADLPWHGVAVIIELQTRRFFCDNDLCRQRIFCERLPSVVAKYGRRTMRLTEALTIIGFVVGGEAGSRLALELGMMVSPDTLLRRVRLTALESSLESTPTPRVLGVDDFAFRRGKRYGTILVDLERRKPIDLLQDREASTLAAWLKAHQGIEVITRDRARAYAEGITEGAPDAVQIADRWHILKNLTDALERFLKRNHQYLRDNAQPIVMPPEPEPTTETSDETATSTYKFFPPRQRKEVIERRQHRLELYNEIVTLKSAGLNADEIAKRTGKSVRTVYRWLELGEFQEHTAYRRSKLDAYLPYLSKRWSEGCHNICELWREIVAQGYSGSYKSLNNYLHKKIVSSRPKQSKTSSRKSKSKRARCDQVLKSSPSPRKAMWMFLKPDSLDEAEQKVIEEIRNRSPEIEQAVNLTMNFHRIVRERKSEELNEWITKVENSQISELKAFASGLGQDRVAVEAALSYEWSNGQVEGQVHRLKLIKRKMYGRAKFDLLKAKVLYSS